MLVNTVKEFHVKHEFAVDERIRDDPSGMGSVMLTVDAMLDESRSQLELFKRSGDQRSLRAHLILEEVAETLRDMRNGDEEGVLDGLADSVYVLAGTAVAFGLPLDEAFIEVHRSNMTKDRLPRGEVATNDPRLREKGASYRRARIGNVLAFHRNSLGIVQEEARR